MSKLISNMSIKTKFVVILLLVLVITTAVVVTVRAMQVREQQNAIISERLQGNANLAVGIFDTVRTYTIWMLDAVTNMPAVQNALASDTVTDREYIENSLAAIFHSMNHIEDGVRAYANILLYDAELRLIAAADPDAEIADLFQDRKSVV